MADFTSALVLYDDRFKKRKASVKKNHLMTTLKKLNFLCLLLSVFCGCQTAILKEVPSRSQGLTVHGDQAKLYTLTNQRGMVAEISNFGATLVRLTVPDRNGNFKDVVLGFNTLKEYEKSHGYIGSTIGRYSGRIGEGKFSLDEATYFLNNNSEVAGFPSHLNGGNQGFDKVMWSVVPMSSFNATGLQLNYTSPDGSGGYPGNLQVTIAYWLTDDNELIIDYTAVTDESTVFNPSLNAYFNLMGEGEGDILNHHLKIEADHYLPVELSLLPRGEIVSVYGTPLDFKNGKKIGSMINEDHPQLKYANGYNHHWVLLEKNEAGLAKAASVYDPTSGRQMEVLTTEPGLQFYSGQGLDGSSVGKSGKAYGKHAGFVVSTGHFPNSPNVEDFPSTRLNPGDTFKSRTIYRFSTK